MIGHEITHGFDDNGSQYAADGNLKNWWTKEDQEKFKNDQGSGDPGRASFTCNKLTKP